MSTFGIKVVRTWLARWYMMLVGKWLLVKPGYELTQKDYNHEGTHLTQERELAYVGFYLWYGVEFIIKLLCCFSWQRAYRSVGFEREAYGHEHDDNYLLSRPSYGWLRYVLTLKDK